MSGDQDYEPETIETETIETESRDHALAKVVAEGDPEEMLATVSKAAAVAEQMREQTEMVLVARTYRGDWTIQGNKACLCSAGAERVGTLFAIRFHKTTWKKEEFTDGEGKGYRYVYSGNATLGNRLIEVQGNYSTRDKFHGKAHGEWKPLEEINEGEIRNAAYHIYTGNGIKALLGMRNIPEVEFERIMKAMGRQTGKTSTVQRGKGTRGGSQATGDEKRHQKELAEACISIANAGMTVELDAEGKWSLRPLSDSDERPVLEIANAICIELSTFEGDHGTIKGKDAKYLTKKWLDSTLGKARKLLESLPTDKEP